MIKRNYSEEFKDQVLKECSEVGNIALVARRYELAPTTIHTWIKNKRKNGKPGAIKGEKELRAQLNKVSSENEELKKLMGEKELKIAVLEDLLKKANPQ